MKNHWLKQREINEDWHHFTIYFDAGRTQVYLDGEVTDVRYFCQRMSDEIIKDIMAEEDAKFMEAIEAACSEELVVPPQPDYEIVFDRQLEHHIEMMGS